MKKTKFLFAVLFVISIAVLIKTKLPITQSFKRENSFEYNFSEQISELNGRKFILSFVTINTKIADIGITSPKTLEKKTSTNNYAGYSLEEYAKLGNYKLVQSGGFLTSWSPPAPLGYVKIQNKEYNKVHNSWLTTGLFCTDGHNFMIEEYQSNEQFARWPSCIQAGPIMIVDGKYKLFSSSKTWPLTDHRHRQSFLCKKNESELIMGIAEDISLKDLSFYLATDLGRFNCQQAVALNPKGVSGLYLNETVPKLIGNTSVPLATAIVIK